MHQGKRIKQRLGVWALGLALFAAACQAEGSNAPIKPRASSPAVLSSPSLTPVSTLPPQIQLPSPSPTPPPLSKPPSAAPTPMPSGFVSPLPPGAFPPDPSTKPSTSALPTMSPSPMPSPKAAVVLSNTLPQGLASLGGFVGDPTREGAAVGNATIRIRSKDLATGLFVAGQTALVKNASDGSFRLDDLAQGVYYVDVSQEGYTGAMNPTEVTLEPSRLHAYTVLSLVKNP